MHTVHFNLQKQNWKDWLVNIGAYIYYFWLHFHAGKCQLMQGIFQKENTDKILKYGIYRHLPTYEKIIRNLVSFFHKKIAPRGNEGRPIQGIDTLKALKTDFESFLQL